jgi:polar amino acid transport system substrate-binding protein
MQNFARKFFVLLLIFFTSCNEGSDEKQALSEKNRDTQANSCNLSVGITPDQVPFSFIQDEKFVGFEIDLMKEIAKYLNCTVHFENLPFYSLMQSLEGSKISLAIAGLTQTPERSIKVAFSKPYYSNSFTLLLHNNKFDTHNPIKDGMIIGVQAGTAMHQWLNNSSLKIQMIVMDKILELVEELENERIDAVLVDDFNGRFIAKEHEKLFNFPLKDMQSTNMAIALQKNDFILKQHIDKALTYLTDNGILEKLKEKWAL